MSIVPDTSNWGAHFTLEEQRKRLTDAGIYVPPTATSYEIWQMIQAHAVELQTVEFYKDLKEASRLPPNREA